MKPLSAIAAGLTSGQKTVEDGVYYSFESRIHMLAVAAGIDVYPTGQGYVLKDGEKVLLDEGKQSPTRTARQSLEDHPEAVALFSGTFASPVSHPVMAFTLGPIIRAGVVEMRNRCFNQLKPVARSYLVQFEDGSFGIGENLPGEWGDDLKARIEKGNKRVRNLVGGLARLVRDKKYTQEEARAQGFEEGIVSNREYSTRVAAGLADDGRLLVFVAEWPGFTTRDLADVIVRCGAANAVLFDGGRSTQIQAPKVAVSYIADSGRKLPSCMVIARRQ